VTAPDAAEFLGPRNASKSTDTYDENQSQHNQPDQPDRGTLILNVLQHVQESFESESFLDSIPLEAVGDPSAWHAWRAYRGFSKRKSESRDPNLSQENAAPSSPKNPGEWKWDGVWESRVSNGVEASIGEAALFGSASSGARATPVPMDSPFMDLRRGPSAAADRQIRFSKLSDERFQELMAAVAQSDTAVSAP
jgi:hypothetical protein